MRWSSKDVSLLLTEMQKFIPTADSVHYQTKLDLIDWELVKFGGYSANECKKQWNLLMKNVRCHRTLSELVDDAKKFNASPAAKKPMSPFMAYFLTERPKVQKKHPKLKCGEIASLLGKKFMALPSDEKEKYKAKYEEEKKLYNECNPYNKIGTSTKRRRDKKPTVAEIPSSEAVELNFPEEKIPCKDVLENKLQASCAPAKKRKVEQEIIEIGQSEDEKPKNPAINTEPAETLAKKVTFDTEFTPNCEYKVKLGFSLYAKEHFTKLVHTKVTEKMSVIAKLWNSLEHEERMPYIKRGQKLTQGAREKFLKDIFEQLNYPINNATST